VEASLLGTEGSLSYDATIGPFVLLLPLLLLPVWQAMKREERNVAGHIVLFLAVNTAIWLWGLARSALLLQARLLLPAFGAAALLGAVGLGRLAVLRRPQLAVDWMARVVFGLALALLLVTQGLNFGARAPLPVLVGLETREAYYARLLDSYAAAMAAVNELPAGATVQHLWEPRTYLCEADCLSDPVLDYYLHLTQGLGLDAPGIAATWRDAGITHVLLSRWGYEYVLDLGLDPVTARDQAVLRALQSDYLEPVVTVGAAYTLYQVR
jgi:hypothetical protein